MKSTPVVEKPRWWLRTIVKYEVIKDYKTSDLDSRVDAYLSSSFSSSFSFSDLAYFNSELGL